MANAEWNRINQNHGWVGRIQHAIQQVVPLVHDVREQWNLIAAYELYTGAPLKVPDLAFMPGSWRRTSLRSRSRGWTRTGWPTCYCPASARRWRVVTEEEAVQGPRVGYKRGMLRSCTPAARHLRSRPWDLVVMKEQEQPRPRT